MKKLMIIATAVMAVVGAKAAAIDWSAQNVGDPWTTAETGKNAPGKGWLGYVILADNYDTVVADLAKGETASLLASAVGPVKTSAANGSFATGTASGTVAGGEQSFHLIILNNGALDKADAFYASAAVTQTVDSSLDTTVAFGRQAGTLQADNWTAMAPEPTSGLLLLIGCAGLALRRRRHA